MRIVLVHRQGPGQFLHLAPHLACLGWRVTLVCETVDASLPGVQVLTYPSDSSAPRGVKRSRHLARAEHDVQTGCRVAEVLDVLRRREGPPNIVVGHTGWGSLLFAKDVMPDTPILGYCEYFYRAEGGDAGFAPHEGVTLDERQRLRLRNMGQLVTLEAIEGGVTATRWQRSRYPQSIQDRIAVCHEGIDVNACTPDPTAEFALPDGRVLRPGDPVVTYAARNLEPYRGFPQFIQAAARVATRNSDALFVVAGGDGVSYGRPPPGARSWREEMMQQSGLDPARIVFLGSISHPELIRLFQISAAHVYLTYPFVLSWSTLEAMACGCLLLGSATPPVEEVVRDGRNGLLTDFWDTASLAELMVAALVAPERYHAIRAAARQTIVRHFGLAMCLEQQILLLKSLARAGARHSAALSVCSP